MNNKDVDCSSEIKSNFNFISARSSLSDLDKLLGFFSQKVFYHNNQNPSCKISDSQLKEVFKRGILDASSLDKPKVLWALARINLFCKYIKGGNVSQEYIKLDRDLANDNSFFIDDGVRENLNFSYEQILEAKLESETFQLNDIENFDFIYLDEFLD